MRLILLLFAAVLALGYDYEPRGTYESRRAEYLQLAARDHKGLYAQVAHLANGQPVDEAPIRAAIQFVDERNDTADFRVNALLRIYRESRPGLLSELLRQDIRRSLTAFKYWVDEPGTDHLMGEWSENHQILFHSSEYLAGQFFPDAVFPNSGLTGRQHLQKARKTVLKWIQTKARAGFSEWDSNAYFPESMAALLNLADYAEDREVAEKARMLLDVMFFDMAVESFHGVFGTSHGRTYQNTVLSGPNEGTNGAEWLAFGMGAPGSTDNVLTVYLAAAKRYLLPDLIRRIALERPAELENRERQGLTIAAAQKLGLNVDDPDDFYLMWDSGRLSNRADAERAGKLLETLNHHRYFVVIKPYADAVIGAYRALEDMGVAATGLDRTTLEQVNKITYKTPDYSLSTAQDYRKGLSGYQQHIWQATLGPESVVFTLNPSVSTKYWVGRFPKAVQYKNLLIAMYRIPSQLPPGPTTLIPPDAAGNAMPSPGPAEESPAGFTEAVFRRDKFTEVIEKNGWVFGRQQDGYIALRSQLPVRWSAKGVLGGEGLIADGRRNIWVCQLGRKAVDGEFAKWVEKVSAAAIRFDGDEVSYDAPGVGKVAMGWDTAMTVDRKPVDVSGYERFDNPYCRSIWGSGKYEIHLGGERLSYIF